MLWDIFCRVIDNFGDIGVCWRLANDLSSRGHAVRLWTDDATALHWMAPGAVEGQFNGVEVLPWNSAQRAHDQPLADVWVEAFGCDIPEAYVRNQRTTASAAGKSDPVWINLEYLSAESYVERSHRLPSPVMAGAGRGLTKHFFYPGFTPSTGGLLREPELQARQAQFTPQRQAAWLRQRGVNAGAGPFVSLFCYEPAALEPLIHEWAASNQPTQLLVTAGRAQAAVRRIVGDAKVMGGLQIHDLPHMPQTEFDHLLWCCDFNCVRGEDSLVRAIWAGKPFVWQIYPQDDGAHSPKLAAFLDMADIEAQLRDFNLRWNGVPGSGVPSTIPGPLFHRQALPLWQANVAKLRHKLLQQDDLTTQLVRFAEKKR